MTLMVPAANRSHQLPAYGNHGHSAEKTAMASSTNPQDVQTHIPHPDHVVANGFFGGQQAVKRV
ncbi:hypothetical protein WBG83_21450 [Paenibacillus sp. y28]